MKWYHQQYLYNAHNGHNHNCQINLFIYFTKIVESFTIFCVCVHFYQTVVIVIAHIDISIKNCVFFSRASIEVNFDYKLIVKFNFPWAAGKYLMANTISRNIYCAIVINISYFEHFIEFLLQWQLPIKLPYISLWFLHFWLFFFEFYIECYRCNPKWMLHECIPVFS